MVGDSFFLHLIQHTIFLLQSSNNSLYRFLQFRETYHLLTPAHGQEGRFIDDIGEIGSREAWGHPGDDLEVRIRAQGHLLCVKAQDGETADLVRTIDQDLPVEPAGKSW